MLGFMRMWSDPSRLPFWFAALLLIWTILGVAAHYAHDIAAAAIGAGVGATVSVAVFLANRYQARRGTTLDLLSEYYSPEFAENRRSAERFMVKHGDTDWSVSDPYESWPEDPDLRGYGAVVRYWQRVAILDREGELKSDLAKRLLAREIGFWDALVFQPMRGRSNMYVRDLLARLITRFSKGTSAEAFEAGAEAGRALAGRRAKVTGPEAGSDSRGI